ncbi:MAG: thiamine pyrophosphate-requiring protein [Myxococcales bacterium]|nr:thiamine pyrophosphate-requiring protein [Myxococcales bacterium]MCB9575549.1 thiamine pyrophosphate-requiring protein [Polyangiaceae bacterium]
MSSNTVSDFVIQRLQLWGISRIYGYPGDGINGLMGALRRAEREMRFVQTRHEELAAFMACAHAKFSGEVGVCMATSGPGAIHLLNGLYDAAMDNQPVVALIGQQATTAIGSDYQQEVDLVSLYKDVAHNFVHVCMNPSQARHLIDRAIRIAKAERSVTCVIFPNDIQEADAVETPPRAHGVPLSGVGYSEPSIVPRERELDHAAELLNSGERVAMLVGAGALGASAEVLETADVLGSGIAKALLGKAVVPDDLPNVTGAIGLLGTEPSDWMMAHCDRLLMVGTSFPYSEWLPKEGQARAAQIDIKPRKLGLRFPTEVNLWGDSRETLRALLPRLKKKEDRSFRSSIEERVRAWWQLLEDRAMNDADPINPQRVFWELSPRLPDECILTADSGSAANWWARDLKIRPGMMASLSGNLATMGPGVPYALAAKLAHPDRPVIAAVGDGAMQMIGMNGLITIARLYPSWTNKQLIVLVLNNGDLNQVTWEQRVMAGDPKFDVSQNLPAFAFAGYAELLGLKGIVMKKPEDIAPGWEEALSADRPVVVEAFTDPEVPPLPPHISFEQATHYWQSIVRGDSNRWRMLKQSVKDMGPSFTGKG